MSGNGGKRAGAGREKGSKNENVPNIKALASKYALQCVESLAKIVTRSKNEGNRIAAASELLNRAYGKPSQAIAGDPEQPVEMIISWKPTQPPATWPDDDKNKST
jgi:hypothetical protein